jgi:hypothetical protein
MKLKYKWDNRKNDKWNVNRIFEMWGEIECEATMKWKTRNGKKMRKKEILKFKKEVWKKWWKKVIWE